MPNAANNGIDPERFAALWAGCDCGNPNEAEALSKFRALRRMALAAKLRIVDVMGRADVVQALDAQLEPVREESPELKAAFLEIAKLADLAKEQEEIISDLQRELASGRPATSMGASRVPHGDPVNAGLMVAVSLVAIALMIVAGFQAFQ